MDNTKFKQTVLVVDDDEQVLKSLRIWLKNEGFNAETASTEAEALTIIKKQRVDVALIDLKMIKEDGIDVSKKIRTLDKRIKLIILTGYPSFDTAVQAMKVGVFDYLSKGSPNEKIMKTIRSALSEQEKEDNVQRIAELPEKDIVRVILFCDHSLIIERLENISKENPTFRLLLTYPRVDSLAMKNVEEELDIALICASCNLRYFGDASRLFTDLFRYFPKINPVIINENFSNNEKVELLKLGVKGFASRVLSSKKLGKGLLHVKRGGFLVNQRVVNLSLKNMSEQNPSQIFKEKNMHGLTSREMEILRIMSQGLKNKEIGEKLGISEKTVKTHLNRIFRKLGVNSRSKAILTVVEKKII